MKILIVDDEEVIRVSLKMILTKTQSNEIHYARDGEEAIGKVKDNAYDIVLLDINMPKLDGYEVLKQIRVSSPNLPVIFITAAAKADKLMQSIAKDKLNAFVEKPFTPEQVQSVVQKAVARVR